MSLNGPKDFYTTTMRRSLLACLCILLPMTTQAQTSDQSAVIKALNAVPVYFVATASGSAPSIGAQQQADFSPVFLYSQEAKIAKTELEHEGATGLNVERAELGVLYSGELSKKTKGLKYGLIANPTQLAAAKRLSANQNFSEVPVFIAKHKNSGEVLTLKQSDGTLAAPLFLEIHRIEAALDELAKQAPNTAGNFTVEAYPLSAIVNDMQRGALNPENVVMIPPVN
ncbi:Tic22 family protein [Marinobacter xiaoshiensis]|uniref:Tic22 family protein n=1 Tax=Marinobacter xiaoshiensis TaxID=3073652 RepID=A0ABU2HFR3_9GAMM|nr:Tic22 family protein [Marinobacter sp. F60267]MDS1309891.1 Tic22 family protein [Marinobacter sp. F60267]